MNVNLEKFFYHFYKTLFSLGLRIYYRKITVAGLDKIPLNEPIITASNHPTGLMDVFLASHHITRQIKFTAAGALFRDKLQAAFLTSVGTIPVYRRKDSPGEQDKNVASFEHCFRELESGGAIGFYPEGTSHPEPWVNPIKTGTARVALQAEDRNDFGLNLSIVPLGINSLHPGKFRSSVFVNIGDPIEVKKYQQAYQQDSMEAVSSLTAEIQQGMETCTFHIQDDSVMNIFDSLKVVGVIGINLPGKNIKSEPEKIYRLIKAWQEKFHIREINKDRVEDDSLKKIGSISKSLNDIKKRMQTYGIVGYPFQGSKTVLRFIVLVLILILGLPIILPSVLINIFLVTLSKNLGKKLAGKDFSLIPAGRLMMGTVIFLLFYLLFFIMLIFFVGLLKTLAISTFFIIGGYLSLWYWEAIKGFGDTWRKIFLWLMEKEVMRNLIQERDDVIELINSLLILPDEAIG